MKNEKIDLFFDTKQAVLDASYMSSVKTLFGLVRHFSDTIHALQQERGASAGFISSNGGKFQNKLKKIRKKSDEQIQALLFYFNLNASSLQQYFNEEEYAALNTKFNHLYLLRENIDALTIEFSKSYSKYTQHIASLLLNIADISDKVENKISVMTCMSTLPCSCTKRVLDKKEQHSVHSSQKMIFYRKFLNTTLPQIPRKKFI